MKDDKMIYGNRVRILLMNQITLQNS